MTKFIFFLLILLLISGCSRRYWGPELGYSGTDLCPININPKGEWGLKQMALFLNRYPTGWKNPNPFYIENGRPVNFFVFDLTDTLNKSFPPQNCIDFIDDHVYHFGAIWYNYAYSHIAVLEGKNMKIFKSLNCRKRGSATIDEVIGYLQVKFKDTPKKEEVLDRVRNYQKYGDVVKRDPMSRIERCRPVKRVREKEE